MNLSVIVPVYNMAGEEKLNHCLDSLVNQTICGMAERKQASLTGDGRGAVPLCYEIIAVDDCSTDDSFCILKEYEAAYPGLVRVLRCDRNRHQGGAKNLGLSAAKGDWIGFIDSDDWVVPDYYERLLQRAEETGADMVGCDYSLVGSYTMTPGQQIANNRPEQAGELDDVKRRSLLLDAGSLCVKVFRRELLMPENSEDAAGAPDENPIRGEEERRADAAKVQVFPEDIFYEDNAVVKTIMLRAKHFEYLPEPLYFYYQHAASTVHTVTRRRLQDRMEAGRISIGEARHYGYLEQYLPELEFSFTRLFYINTLFSAMREWNGSDEAAASSKRVRHLAVYRFVTALAKEMKDTFPEFRENPYYQSRVDAEEKKLIALQMRSPVLFYLYYRALWAYRKARYGR